MKKLLLVRRIVGGSMLPDLVPGQVVLGVRFKRLRVGDVVILLHDGMEKVKRVARLEGEQVYVVGDNTAASTDSRHFGLINRAHILARVVWPRV